MRTDLDQAEFANLRPGTAAAAAAVGVAESRRVGGGIGDALDRAIEGHQPPGVVESAGRLPRGQRAHGALEQAAYGCQTEALARNAQAGAVGRRFAGLQASRRFEDLPDRQVGPDAHGQDDPKDHLAGQDTSTAVKTGGVLQGLLNAIGSDNLFEEQQPIENPSCLICRQQATSLSHRHSLPETQVLSKLKVSDGCDLRFVQRYWA